MVLYILQISGVDGNEKEIPGFSKLIGPGDKDAVEEWLKKNSFQRQLGDIWSRDGRHTLKCCNGNVDTPVADKVWAKVRRLNTLSDTNLSNV